MKFFSRLFLFVFVVLSIFAAHATAQTKKPTATNVARTAKATATRPAAEVSEKEKTALEAAQSPTNPFERIEKLKEFVAVFPRSSLKTRAQESLVVARGEYGDELLASGDREGGVKQFKQAVAEATAEMSDKLFAEVLSRFPPNLYFRGEQAAAFEAAKRIEAKAGDNADRLIALAQFYFAIENSAEARRLASRAVELNPNSANAQNALGMANRIGFRLEAASQSFARALEADPKSAFAKRNLADAYRGLGQAEDAAKLYREILAENEKDDAARTGLVLSLFGAGNRQEAESEMEKALAQNSNNYQLLATAAYWYAANGEGAKAVELGERAVAVEPRYTWAHIALARGLLLEKKPLEAEKTLLIARQYGNFPTLDYELANTRLAAGFYEEAAADLKKSFLLKNGAIETRLANRIEQQSQNFVDLLALERRASILQPASADLPENADRLKNLLAFAQAFDAEKPNEAVILKASQEFVAGADAARVHRQLYAANRLLRAQIALEKVLELTQTATEGVDAGVEVPAAAAAVLAEELYAPRQTAAVNGSIVQVPEIPRPTLINILRGRVEEIAGWTLFNQGKTDEAVVRLKRAVGILPESSAWWRSSQWRLGAALEKADKPREALEAYVKSYKSAAPDAPRRAAIEALYFRLNGSMRGLDAKLGEATTATAAQQNSSVPFATPTAPAVFKNPLPSVIAEINQPGRNEKPAEKLPERPAETPVENKTSESAAAAVETPAPTPETSPTPEEPTPLPEPSVEPTPEAVKNDLPAAPEPTPIETPAPTPEPEKVPVSQPAPTPEKTVEPNPAPEQPNEDSAPERAESKSNAPDDSPPSESRSEATKTEPPVDATPETRRPPRVVLIDRLQNTVTDIPTKPAAKNENQTIVEKERPPMRRACSIWTSQETISILSGGGKASVLVANEGDESPQGFALSISDATQIAVELDRAADQNNRRALYEIRSLTEKKGEYTVKFFSPCSKKEIKIRVR
jgi:tetratricopeptide (TPR) repeat protein